MVFPHSFYDDEIRCNFMVPSMIKRTWAAGLEILAAVDRVCRKYGIEYFAEWGTLLGAVRHGGYIPWDDDLDICMKRADYIRFLEVAENELPGYSIVNYKSNPSFRQMLSRIVNTDHYRFDRDFLEDFSGLPFAMGIDIFPLDYLSDDEVFENNRYEKVYYITQTINQIIDDGNTVKNIADRLDIIEYNCDVLIDRNADILSQLRCLLEQIYGQVNEKDAKFITLYPLWFNNHNHKYPVDYYKRSIRLPFEMIDIPVPLYYGEILSFKYGAGYMTPVKSGGAHGYPYYQNHIDVLKESFDFEWPHYNFTECDVMHQGVATTPCFHEVFNNYMKLLREQHQKLLSVIHVDDMEKAEVLCTCQDIAIELGGLIEMRYYEGSQTISLLESYCEYLFEMSQISCGSADVSKLNEILDETYDKFTEELFPRKVVLTVPTSLKSYNNMKHLYLSEYDGNTIVKVMPLPHIEVSPSLSNMNTVDVSIDDYKGVDIVDYKTFDFATHPDEIVMDYPYDEYNLLSFLDKSFHARTLRTKTNRLIYVPFFETNNIEVSDARSIKNMPDYMDTPLVALCDKMIIGSETARKGYVEYLCNSAPKYSEVWRQRLVACEPDTLKHEQRKRSEERTVMYYIGIDGFIVNPDAMLKKMERVFSIFYEAKEQIKLVVREQTDLKEHISQFLPEYYDRYILTLNMCKSVYGFTIDDADRLPSYYGEICDAYYGEASAYVPEFSIRKKPVMIHNPGII